MGDFYIHDIYLFKEKKISYAFRECPYKKRLFANLYGELSKSFK